MSTTTSPAPSTPSAQDLDALDALDLRTPLVSTATPSGVPAGSTPFGQPATGQASTPAGAGPYTPDATLPYSLTWPGMASGTSVVVSGGAYGVNTDDLTGLAATLNSAADWLEDARDLALTCLTELRCGGLGFTMYTQPLFGSSQRDFGFGTSSQSSTASDQSSSGFASKSDALTSGGGQCLVWALGPSATERTNAIAALEALTSGVGSLDDAASSLRTLATDVTACGTAYTDADTEIDGKWLLLLQGVRLGSNIPGVTSTSPGAQVAVAILALLSADGVTLPDGVDDALQGLETVLNDPLLAGWATTDLLILVGLTVWAQQANTGHEAAVIETYIGQVAEELDPAITAALPAQVQVGSRTVDTSSLTPMQRVAYYLALRSEQAGTQRYGEPTGVTVTPHGGQSVTVPTGVQDPFGLGTAVPAVAAGMPQACTTAPQPGTAAEVIRYSADMKGSDEDTSSGIVSILRTDHADGTTSWLVVVPGTTDWGSGNTNPQDLLTNLQAVSGRPTDMESAVVTAMREAGIAPGDKVGLYGHSQGAITASNVAADPAVNAQFNITNLLTAGGPTAGANLPDNVNALHIENTGDAVPALDGTATPRTPTRTVVTVDTHAAGVNGYPHGAPIYADAVDGISGDPQIDQWTEELAGLTGSGESGADTTEIIFDITRDSPETAWEKAASTVGKKG
ncbi:hypothetical protein DRB06_10070 [Actinomyces sp. Z5]|uniref:hypothetical protein n=1 Tax=Actinomyces sp. Z5 TaxID=2250216 RepID=UPI000DCDC26E|nr:hypothetical protein [Actinomyces sp. Z5]RAX20049.1 hypothetical protein DRB06_10070 [Actinomyces sp. Z5]